jgi:5-methylcytosine-specific restriction endonuclease McrA
LKYLVDKELKRQKKKRGLLPKENQEEDRGCCEAFDPTGRCSSRYQLEIDHIVPHAKGGSDLFENLRLCCRAHNLKHAIEDFGETTMEKFRS